jgi:trehalose 6-phosphate synthase/phosphatase
MTMSIQDMPIAVRRSAPRAAPGDRPLLLVANRLPISARMEAGDITLVPSSGGLATALGGIQGELGARWIGWHGVGREAVAGDPTILDRQLADLAAVGVTLDAAEVGDFYDVFCNGVLWPCLHGLPAGAENPTRLARAARTYAAVNTRFADVVAREAPLGSRVWIHDYQLMLLPRLLRRRRPDLRIAFFLHTPFPDVRHLETLPGAASLLAGLLGADVVGFHIGAYATRFAEAVRHLLGRAAPFASATRVRYAGRDVRVFTAPMSVDVEAFARRAADPLVAARAARLRGDGPLFVGVERLDPTKGLPERLEAMDRLLACRPELRGRVRLLQLAIPSRERVPAYRALRERVEAQVRALNQRWGTATWQPVSYRYGSLEPTELAAWYRAADVMLVTPLCDGMNLVAKEFVASRVDQDGVLVLSENAGAAAELAAALRVDPRDPAALAAACSAALDMSAAERRVRMRHLTGCVRRYDVRRWAAECLRHLEDVRRRTARSAP